MNGGVIADNYNCLFILSSTVSHVRFSLDSLNNILKAYEIHLHPVQNQDYWSPYTGPNISDSHMRRSKAGRPTTYRIHNEMDDPIPNRPKKCSYCRNEGHNRTNCRYRQ